MGKRWIPLALLVTASLLLAACGSSGGGGTGATAAPVPTETETQAPPSPEETSNEAGGLIVTAPPNSIQVGFEPKTLEAPAGQPLTITFNNEDPGIPHNVQIFAGPKPSGKILWAPPNNATINGGESVDYEIPALDPGTYAFNCYVHPTMTGTLTVA